MPSPSPASCSEHPKVEWVNYPGLPTHPAYAPASKYHTRGKFGAILGFGVKGGLECRPDADRIGQALLAPGQRRRRQVADHPPGQHHPLSADPEEQALTGVTDDYVRLSVGLETASDIIDDLDQALAKI